MKFTSALLVAVYAAAASAKVLYTRTQPPSGWAVREAADPETPVTFIVALKQQNLDVLEKTFYDVSTPGSDRYREFMGIDEISDMVRPTDAVRSRAAAWLSQYVREEDVQDMGDAFKVTTVASVAELALSTRFVNFHHHRTGRKAVRQYGPYSIPSELDDAVDMVSGVSEFPDVEGRRNKMAPAAFDGVVPQTLAAFYNGAGLSASGNSSVGVIEWEGQGYSPADLASFATKTATTIPALSSDHVIGNSGASEGDEAQLDIEYALASGVGAEGWFWLNSDQNAWLYGWSTAFFGTADVPYVVSMSYGWSEAAQCTNGIGGAECQQLGIDSLQYVTRVNTEFMKIGLRGVSLFASSGDSGANGRTDGYCSDKILHPTYPAASPYVTAVGATQVTNPQTSLSNPPPVCSSGSVTCISGGTETAVSYAQAHFTSGGGFSNVAARPAYQKTAVESYLSGSTALPPASYYNQTGRGYPDVAAAGSNVVIVYQGQVQGVGGTSCSSPIFAGYAAVWNTIALQKDGKPLGFMNPLIYQLPASAFNDITVGANKCTEDGCGLFGACKGYECAAGWDPVTGRGTPNAGFIANYIKNKVLA